MTLPDSKLGDKGQRYEVTARWDGIIRTVGYCERDYEAFADAFLLHPAIDRVTVIDRHHPELQAFMEFEGRCKGCGFFIQTGMTECPGCGSCGPRSGGAPPVERFDPAKACIYRKEKLCQSK